MKKFFVILVFFCASSAARAAGGSCPSAANYTNPSNPTGALVTLANLGITSCYYIAANGVNTNTGIDELHPWLYAPGMNACSGTCATVQNTSGGIPAGTGFIFRGGDAWHFGNSALSPYSVAVPACSTNGTLDGGWCLSDKYFKASTTTNPYYLGVDKAWFKSVAWSRPIVTDDNPPCNAGTLGTLPGGTGATCTQTTDQFNQPTFYVSACQYHTGTKNYLVNANNAHMWILDNLEFTGICGYQLTVGVAPNAQDPDADTYFRYGSAAAPIVFQNLYVHGSSHLKFAGPISIAGTPCNGPGVYCKDLFTWHGSTAANPGETLVFNDVDFSDSDGPGQQLCFGGFYNVAYNYFNSLAGCLPNPLHVFHDNTYINFFECGHCNLLESAGNDVGPISAIYNNFFGHVEQFITGSGGGVGLWPHPAPGNTDYIFNNVYWDIGQLQVFNMGGGGQNFGNETVFNNTIQSNGSQNIYRCENYQAGTVSIINEQAITEGGSYLTSANCNGRLAANNPLTVLFENNSTANSSGYTSLTNPVYAPQSISSPTVNAGTNEMAICSVMSASSDALIQAAGTACLSATTGGVTVTATKHAVIWPAITPVVRDAVNAWDQGAYEWLAGGGAPPNLTPPMMDFDIVPQGTSAATQLATIVNNSTSVVTFTGGSGGVSISGPNLSDFSETSTCGATLAINASCTYTVGFVPSASVGTAESATLSVSFTGPSGSPLSISLAGNSGQRANVGPALLFYGETLSGCAPCPSNCLCFTREPAVYQSSGGIYSYFWKPVVIP